MGCTFYTPRTSLLHFLQVNLSQHLSPTHSSCYQWAFHTLYPMSKLRRILAGVLPTAQSKKLNFLLGLNTYFHPIMLSVQLDDWMEILGPETYFFFWVLMTFLFRYLPQASSVYTARVKSAAFYFLMLVSWKGFVGVGSRFRSGRLKGDTLSGCKLVNISCHQFIVFAIIETVWLPLDFVA